MPPAAPSRWPVIDLVELTASFFACVAEAALDRDGLGDIAQRRRGAVGVDVIDLVAVDAAVAQRIDHAARGALAVFARRGDVVGIGAHAITGEFAVNARAALLWRVRILRAPARRRLRPARSRRGPCPTGGWPARVHRCAWTARARRRNRRRPACEPQASAPPAIITSASPYSIRRPASPMLWLAVVQALTTAMFGPLRPYMIESWPEIMLMMVPGTKNGEILRGPPASIGIMRGSSISGRPPMPEPMQTPICSRVSLSRSRPESLSASMPAARP